MEENQQIPTENFENKKITKKNNKALIIVILIVLIASIGIAIFILCKNNIFGNSSDDPTIDRYEIQTSSGFQEIDVIPYCQFKITNIDEFNTFCELYEGFEFTNNYDLSNNTLFIETRICSSGSTKITIDKVIINDKVSFKTSSKSPNVCTMDMAYWYLVAVIPNEKLKSVNTDNWISPIDAKNKCLRSEYYCAIESSDLNALISLREKINEIGNIEISKYYYSNEGHKEYYEINSNSHNSSFIIHGKMHSFSLLSYDENSIKQLVDFINNNDLGVSIIDVSESFIPIAKYNEYKELLTTQNNIAEARYKIELAYDDDKSNSINKEVLSKVKESFPTADIVDNDNQYKRGNITIIYNNLNTSELLTIVDKLSNNYKNLGAKNFKIESSFD